MAKVDPSLWREMIAYLRQHHSSVCRQWFEDDLEAVDIGGGMLRVQTATTIQQNYLQNRCLDHFNEAAQAVTGHLVAVRFENQTQPRPSTNGSLSNSSMSVNDNEIQLQHTDHETNGRNNSPFAENSLGFNDNSLSTTTTTSAPQPTVSTSLSPAAPRPAPLHVTGHDDEGMVLSPDYSFDHFITGPNNQLAYAAAVAVANQPGTAYNPLFIHGGVGLGKTHLLQAICQKILTDTPDAQILYVSCDAFMNQFIENVQSGKMNDFRHRYRYVDVLVIDDIHFLGSRERTQEEFFHTFNELYQQNKQIVLSSDAAPTEIPHLEDRLVSRFQWGLVANVTKPHYETRVAILRAKANLRGIEMPDEVIALIANKIESNARELEGAITTLQAHSALTKAPIDLKLARSVLGEPVAEPRSNQVTLQKIIDVVTTFYGVKLSDLQSKRRHKSVTEPRQVCMWLARKWTRFSLEEIGGYFGGRDHTTVMHSIRAVEERTSQTPAFKSEVDKLDRELEQNASQSEI